MSTVLQFVPFNSSIDPTFWHTLTKLKIDTLKLSEEPIPIRAWYERGRWVQDRESFGSNEIGMGGDLRVDGKSFSVDEPKTRVPGRVTVHGILKNYNKIEDFKSCDKQALFNSFSDNLWKNLHSRSILDQKDENFPTFLVINFADLKKYRYFYWFGFPAFIPKPSWTTLSEDWSNLRLNDSIELGRLISESEGDECHWIAKREAGKWFIGSSSQWSEFFPPTLPTDERYVLFIDPAVSSQALGWPLRNILAKIFVQNGSSGQRFNVIAYRDPVGSNQSYSVTRSLLLKVELPEQVSHDGNRPSAIGWEKNSVGKLGPRMADLAPMMDPKRLAEQAVDLNLKLMRWRILPELDLEKISSTRCLLLGAGTLGCYVARTLMAWGVRKITLVDSAKVSFSNPVRQPLFEFQDCIEAGKPKAECAAAALKRIYPGIDAKGVELSIPMPGHPIAPNLVDKTKGDVRKLEELFDQHDVIYLLMDSRESRWLPTVLGASKRKLVMNAALGFDSYLVMRHGVRSQIELSAEAVSGSSIPQIRQLGCYFCNDVVAPADSLTDRTLDQMCTVTRPGLAPIASATAVEIMAAVLQHPNGIEALAEVNNSKGQDSRSLEESSPGKESVLGTVPHQVRGFLSKFENLKLVGPAYDKCTGCSERVIMAYEKEGFEGMLIKVFNEEKYLEKLTGLDKLYSESEKLMESLDWDEDEEDE
ncbi:hypothetical protein BY996DRAFT_4576611 [Phakopsora pachyrhizi]|uniref:Ubiquitin-like modifier-activating enzyme ATG7 n=1 Tax=Phakopsora pachyrhizi TaxID=170000 RepID=A0AAV0ARP3_PHAPC|nr:hypothetical protein BY996DRAFT_4576611 [Phakopsora pachyrhizi]CAH7671090.1 hypothetical protein PPACK8108_LOCUS5852 [Phakopsora pachyrhizi]